MIRRRTLAEHWAGTKAFAVIKGMEAVGGEILVPVEEAERRAGICVAGDSGSRCPQNIEVNGESLIDGLQNDLMAKQVDGHTTSQDSNLGTCNACSCRLRTIVHLKAAVLKPGMSEVSTNKHPAFCWKHDFA